MNNGVSLGDVLSNAAAWMVLFLVLFFATFKLWAPLLVDGLCFVLESLNSFGSGF